MVLSWVRPCSELGTAHTILRVSAGCEVRCCEELIMPKIGYSGPRSPQPTLLFSSCQHSLDLGLCTSPSEVPEPSARISRDG